jgi:hypothetical protein
MLVSSGKDANMILWSADGNILQKLELPKHAVHTVDISPHGSIFAAGMAQSTKSSKDARGAYPRLVCLSAPASRTSVDGLSRACSRPHNHTADMLMNPGALQHSVCGVGIVW